MEPGPNPQTNDIFLTFTAAVVRAISVHGDLLRASIAVPGNEHRLGANEAPPAIISVFLGNHLDEVVQNFVASTDNHTPKDDTMHLGVYSLPHAPKDASDRNRTSPFAFTGNKFEFRAVGSSQSCARPVTYLNAAMSESLNHFADEVEKLVKGGKATKDAVHEVARTFYKEHSRAIFGGNGYSQEWRDEAARRGLWNLRTLPEAVQQLTSEKNAKLFEAAGIFNDAELKAQQSTLYEHYCKHIQIESDVMFDMASSGILPVALSTRARCLHLSTHRTRCRVNTWPRCPIWCPSSSQHWCNTRR